MADEAGIPNHLSARFDHPRSPIWDAISVHRGKSMLPDFAVCCGIAKITSSGNGSKKQETRREFHMAIKQLLTDGNLAIQELAQWEQRRESIRARLFETIGIPPVTRNTRSIQIVNEEKLGEYVRSKISYIVGEGERITAYQAVEK